MNRFPILLPLCAVLAYVPTVDAYTTSLTVIASANAAYGSQSYDADSKVVNNIDSQSADSVNAFYKVPNTGGPGSLSEIYHSSASGFVSPGVLKASASASATPYAANLASGSSKVSFADDFKLVGPSGRNIDLTLSYLVSGALAGTAAASGLVELSTGDRISFTENGYTSRSFSCSRMASCGGVATFSVPVNTLISLLAILEVGASATSYFKPTLTESAADFGSTGLVYLGITDSRYDLVTGSGFAYAPVPLPTAFWSFATSLCALGCSFLRRRI
ncbi:MAG: hypothetical protein BVN35_03620 [Proteobacteria bacterium ST_bin11]|nr:MAG: hypothetical protein BVN35_03620 [Proteobacteria bacterium ST_bin11]